MEGRCVLALDVNRPDLRYPFPPRFAERVTGHMVTRLGRQAKFLTAELSSGEMLIMHLGMSGRFTVTGGDVPQFASEDTSDAKHDHVVFHIEGGITITYNDPRRFGFMELWPVAQWPAYPRLRDIGPEPLGNTFTAAYLDEALAKKSAPVKSALLDQKIIAGLGNIYVCEALFRAGISPRRKALTIRGERSGRLVQAINEVISEAIDAGGSTLKDFAGTDGALGYFQHRFGVYDREGEPCPVCAGKIKRITQSGRSTFYCGTCQR